VTQRAIQELYCTKGGNGAERKTRTQHNGLSVSQRFEKELHKGLQLLWTVVALRPHIKGGKAMKKLWKFEEEACGLLWQAFCT
jgi:hypothetical protein